MWLCFIYMFSYERTINAILEQSLPEPLRSVSDPSTYTDSTAAELRQTEAKQSWPSLGGENAKNTNRNDEKSSKEKDVKMVIPGP